jgi:hypothetical protein
MSISRQAERVPVERARRLREPCIHSRVTDCPPDRHPLACSRVRCDRCQSLVHLASNSCMRTWVESGRGNFCLRYFVPAGGGATADHRPQLAGVDCLPSSFGLGARLSTTASAAARRLLAASARAPRLLGLGCLWDRSRASGNLLDCLKQFVALLLERSDDPRQPALTFARQADPSSPAVPVAGLADDQTSLLSAADGAGDRVRLDAQLFGDLVDRRPFLAARRALDHQEQQIPLRRKTRGPRRFLGGVLERSKRRAEAGDRDIVRPVFRSSHYEINTS